MNIRKIHIILFFASLLAAGSTTLAQRPSNILRGIGNRIPTGGQPGPSSAPGSGDSIQHRNRFEDSVTVNIYYLDSPGAHKLDSSINDFTRRFPIPSTHIFLGNTGTATRSILFAPAMKTGFDPGFHALDVYKWTLDKARFFNTTRPYTELNYLLGSRSEQIIEVLHTQNLKPSFNFSFNYRLINSIGIFRNQKTNHNNYLFTTWYQAPSKRYNNYFVLLGNTLQAGENGGIKNDEDYLNDIAFAKDRYLIPTQLGGNPQYSTNFFNTALYTGNSYGEFNLVMRQQYDFGKKDSLVTDSTVVPLFYPKLRFEHSFNYGKYHFGFRDYMVNGALQNNTPDSTYYYDNYGGLRIPSNDSVHFRDSWKEITNDFSIYQFPDAKNLRQFFKLGASLQVIHGSFENFFTRNSRSFVNAIGHGEYRNLSRNKKWDILAFGKLYLSGYNLGDYHAYISLQRQISRKIGSLQAGFENVNRTAPMFYDSRSAFYLEKTQKNFNKENTIHFFGALTLPALKMTLSGDYYLLTNYLYLTNYYQLRQEGTLFNVLRINALKTIRLGKHWNWHAEVYVQQKTGSEELHMPALYTRNRLMYEGNLGFKNLDMAMGLEGRYNTPYKPDNYSPVLGQFFYQDSVTISNLPDIAAFMHLRIRSFKAYLRAENLNTARVFGGFQFNNNNLVAPGYPTPGLVWHFGIYWSFVN